MDEYELDARIACGQVVDLSDTVLDMLITQEASLRYWLSILPQMANAVPNCFWYGTC